MKAKKIKTRVRKCKTCKEEFEPRNKLQKHCGLVSDPASCSYANSKGLRK